MVAGVAEICSKSATRLLKSFSRDGCGQLFFNNGDKFEA